MGGHCKSTRSVSKDAHPQAARSPSRSRWYATTPRRQPSGNLATPRPLLEQRPRHFALLTDEPSVTSPESRRQRPSTWVRQSLYIVVLDFASSSVGGTVRCNEYCVSGLTHRRRQGKGMVPINLSLPLVRGRGGLMLSVGCILTCWSFVKYEPEALDTRWRTATSSVLGLRMRKHGQIYGGSFGRSLLTFKSEYQQGERTRVGGVPYPNPNTNPNHRRRSVNRFHTLPHSHRFLTYVYACIDLRGERTQAREKSKGVRLVKTYAILNLRAVAKNLAWSRRALSDPSTFVAST